MMVVSQLHLHDMPKCGTLLHMPTHKRVKRPTLETLAKEDPLTPRERTQVRTHRKEIRAILDGSDDRLLVITGPCSAWPDAAVLEYAKRLAELRERHRDTLNIVMRVYTQKPRTTTGWAGVVVQPDPFAAPSIVKGARYARRMMRDVLALGLPIADEMLFTHKYAWLGDLLSWVAIGARSSEDHEHRVFASGLDVPVGLKNPTSGDLVVAVNSVVSAQASHTHYEQGYEVTTAGNPYAHLVLRGGKHPNYRARHLELVRDRMSLHNATNPAVIVDASHGNATRRGIKDPMLQAKVARDVARLRKSNTAYRALVRGIMLESFLAPGAQKLAECTTDTVRRDGCSITDPCISWEDTERVLASLTRM